MNLYQWFLSQIGLYEEEDTEAKENDNTKRRSKKLCATNNQEHK